MILDHNVLSYIENISLWRVYIFLCCVGAVSCREAADQLKQAMDHVANLMSKVRIAN